MNTGSLDKQLMHYVCVGNVVILVPTTKIEFLQINIDISILILMSKFPILLSTYKGERNPFLCLRYLLILTQFTC